MAEIELRIKQWPEGLGQIRSALQALVEQGQLGDDVGEAFLLALEELVANVFGHGAGGEVALSIVCDGRKLSAEVVDSGPPSILWPPTIRTSMPGSTSGRSAGSVSFWSKS